MQIPDYFYIVITVLTALIALSFLVQAGVVLGFFIAFVKMREKLESIVNHLTEHALPLITSTKATVDELTPKIHTITENLAEISETLKQETKTIKVSVDDVLDRTRAQTARVDEMVSGTLDGISHAGATIQHGIEVPIRHIYGVFNGLKAAFETFKSKPARNSVYSAATVQEPVIVVAEVVVPQGPPV
jgi:hypothetical protein